MELKLEHFRKLAGFKSRDACAEALGVNKFTYRAWERGDNSPSFVHLCACADLFGCSVDALTGKESFSIDADKDRLVACYNNMNETGKATLLTVAKSLERDPANRAKKNQRAPDTIEESA